MGSNQNGKSKRRKERRQGRKVDDSKRTSWGFNSQLDVLHDTCVLEAMPSESEQVLPSTLLLFWNTFAQNCWNLQETLLATTNVKESSLDTSNLQCEMTKS